MIINRRVCDLEPPELAADATLMRFGLDGAELEIDLCAPHRLEFLSMSDYWATHGRCPPRNDLEKPGRTAERRRRAASTRAWARELPPDRLCELTGAATLSEHGRLPRALERAYDAEHA